LAVSAREVPSAAFATASCFAASAALMSSGSALASSLASTPMARRGTGPRGASGNGVGRDARRGATARARVERAPACDAAEGDRGGTETGDRLGVSVEPRWGVAAAERARGGHATRRWFAGSQTQALSNDVREDLGRARARSRAGTHRDARSVRGEARRVGLRRHRGHRRGRLREENVARGGMPRTGLWITKKRPARSVWSSQKFPRVRGRKRFDAQSEPLGTKRLFGIHEKTQPV
jgi:hypothetical protein